MEQTKLTDDRVQNRGTSDPNNENPNQNNATGQKSSNPPNYKTHDELEPIEEHPAVESINIAGMELETNVDDCRKFPHPEVITSLIDEDMDADKAVFPDEVNDAIDKLTSDSNINEFLVMDAEDVYTYLETLQKKSDLYLENFHRKQLLRNQLSNGRGYAQGSKLSTYDKKWICEWEVRRRLVERDFEKWGDETLLSKENTGLPNESDN